METPMLLLAILLPVCIVLSVALMCCRWYCMDQGDNHDLYYPPPREYKPTEPLTRRVEEFHYGSVPDGSGGVPILTNTGYCYGYTTSEVKYNI